MAIKVLEGQYKLCQYSHDLHVDEALGREEGVLQEGCSCHHQA